MFQLLKDDVVKDLQEFKEILVKNVDVMEMTMFDCKFDSDGFAYLTTNIHDFGFLRIIMMGNGRSSVVGKWKILHIADEFESIKELVHDARLQEMMLHIGRYETPFQYQKHMLN